MSTRAPFLRTSGQMVLLCPDSISLNERLGDFMSLPMNYEDLNLRPLARTRFRYLTKVTKFRGVQLNVIEPVPLPRRRLLKPLESGCFHNRRIAYSLCRPSLLIKSIHSKEHV